MLVETGDFRLGNLWHDEFLLLLVLHILGCLQEYAVEVVAQFGKFGILRLVGLVAQKVFKLKERLVKRTAHLVAHTSIDLILEV